MTDAGQASHNAERAAIELRTVGQVINIHSKQMGLTSSTNIGGIHIDHGDVNGLASHSRVDDLLDAPSRYIDDRDAVLTLAQRIDPAEGRSQGGVGSNREGPFELVPGRNRPDRDHQRVLLGPPRAGLLRGVDRTPVIGRAPKNTA